MTQITFAPYEWWTRALAGEKIGGPTLPVHENQPHAGFYRRQFRARRAMGEGVAPKGPFVPVAIFERDGYMVALIKGIPEEADRHWTHCCRHPVTEEAYRHAVETGEWLDAPAESAPPPIGHNAPPDDIETLKDQIAAAADGVPAYAKIEDDETEERAQALRSRLLELSRTADKKRDELKRPHLEAGKAIDATYQPLVKSAKASADQIASAIGAYETAKARANEEARRKAAEAAKEGTPAPQAPPPAALPTQIKGAYGRAATVAVVKVVTRVTDWDALWNFMRDHPEVKDILAQLAQRAVTKGHTVPGVEVEEQRKVR